MPYAMYVLEGEMFENRFSIVSGKLSVYPSDGRVALRKHTEGLFRGKELFLLPFSPSMFLGAAIRNGYEIAMQGSDLGSYSDGPLGHPGDGEYRVYTLLRASISGRYGSDGLDIRITADTGAGKDVCRGDGTETGASYPALALAANFTVPREQLVAFLEISTASQHYRDIFGSPA